MEKVEILSRLRGVMEEASTKVVDWSEFGDVTTIEELGFDSLSILDVLYGVEQAFGIEIDVEEVADLRTVGELVAALEGRL